MPYLVLKSNAYETPHAITVCGRKDASLTSEDFSSQTLMIHLNHPHNYIIHGLINQINVLQLTVDSHKKS